MNSNDFNTTDRSARRRGRLLGSQFSIGLVVVLVGISILLRRMDVPLPDWMFGWQMILIVIGVITGINSKFKDISWIIPIIVGLVFILDDVHVVSFRRYVWPLGIIAIGLIIALRPKMSRWGRSSEMGVIENASGFTVQDATSSTQADPSYTTTADDQIDATAVFGGVKRSVVSKQFRGGEIVAVFGGAEINLAHADFTGVIKLEVVNVLGGTKLIVPANWDIQSTMVAVFGGVDDKRFIRPELIDPNKRLIIEGTSFLGGLEIKSF